MHKMTFHVHVTACNYMHCMLYSVITCVIASATFSITCSLDPLCASLHATLIHYKLQYMLGLIAVAAALVAAIASPLPPARSARMRSAVHLLLDWFCWTMFQSAAISVSIMAWAQTFSHWCFLRCHGYHKNQYWMAFNIRVDIWEAHLHLHKKKL